MLDKFKKVELKDKELIERYLAECDRMLCDYNFANIFTWRNIYDTRWALIDNMPVIYINVDDLILMPCSCCVSFDNIINLSESFRTSGKSGNFALIDKEFVENNSEQIEKYFSVELDEANADYIYSTEKLVELRGKKLQKKKNLVSQFIRNNPDYNVEILAEEHFTESFALAEKWCQQRDCEKLGFSHEKSALREAFENFDELNLSGLIIRLNGNIIAFSVFSRQNSETYTIHYEKFDTELKGSGQLINWETAKFLQNKCRYLNREQDMGLDFMLYTYKLFRKIQ